MSKQRKKILVIGILFVALLFVMLVFRPKILGFFAKQADGILHTGTWEDDHQNWYRAFKEQQPVEVKVVHSKYWRSDHFTVEFIYYFEVEAQPKWKDAFLKRHDLTQLSPSVAKSFRTNISSDETPSWFAPDPVELYDVWDKNGYFGSVWINKTNGHVFFYKMQL